MGLIWDFMGFGDFIVMKHGVRVIEATVMILCRNVVSGFRGDELIVSWWLGWAEWLVTWQTGWWFNDI